MILRAVHFLPLSGFVFGIQAMSYRVNGKKHPIQIPRFCTDAMCLGYVPMSKIVYAAAQFKPVAERSGIHPNNPS